MQVIREFPQPKTRHKLREFLGLINFYHRFIPGCADILHPLNDLLSASKDSKKDIPRNDQAIAAFSDIKGALAKVSLLVHPKPDALPASSPTLQT